ncbi:MAG: helix-turn-helix transcriptional regulator [Marinoscillum sp.]
MIQQPKLGELLVQLRKKKGWTQEELVETCNVSVRTIQRIESGEVTPRTSTIKLLLAALDYDPKEWKGFTEKEESDRSPFKLFKNMLALNLPENQLKKSFQDAWIAGIIYLLFYILDTAMEFILSENRQFLNQAIYISVKVATMGTLLLFMRGFISLATLLENQLLKIASYLSLSISFLWHSSDIALMLLYPNLHEMEGVLAAGFILFSGATAIFYGIGLRRLQDAVGKSAKYAGTVEVIMGICLMTIILSPVALVIVAPALILEIMILAKADDLAKKDLI